MKIVAFIPARGGSKGIRDKNLQEVGGMSLIERSILFAKAHPLVEQVFVSTDSQSISESAERLGAFVVHRPESIAGDTASSESAISHFLGLYPSVEVVVFLQATSPFVEFGPLERAIDMVIQGDADSVFSAFRTHGFRWRFSGGNVETVGHSAARRERRQDLQPEFEESGAFYVFRRSVFDAEESRFCGQTKLVEVDPRFAVEIDRAEDLEVARCLSALWQDKPTIGPLEALVLDFDGVQTNNLVTINSEGNEFVQVNRADGLGISLLQDRSLRILFLSSESNSVVNARARKLGVECIQGVTNKDETLQVWAEQHSINLSKTAYMGNDLNDENAMRLVGYPVAVFDAHPRIISLSSFVLSSKGGSGAIREFADMVATS